jgi:hypothetical protein
MKFEIKDGHLLFDIETNEALSIIRSVSENRGSLISLIEYIISEYKSRYIMEGLGVNRTPPPEYEHNEKGD